MRAVCVLQLWFIILRKSDSGTVLSTTSLENVLPSIMNFTSLDSRDYASRIDVDDFRIKTPVTFSPN